MNFQPFTTKMHNEGKPFSHKLILGSFYHKIKRNTQWFMERHAAYNMILNNFVFFFQMRRSHQENILLNPFIFYCQDQNIVISGHDPIK